MPPSSDVADALHQIAAVANAAGIPSVLFALRFRLKARAHQHVVHISIDEENHRCDD